ncbi:hypothetical protein [Pseudomonas sp. KNUC1026]|uniref:hypothetical protein n=1 Tax=Pseudomonas sp. KNUC1026 TaxID=2893890 RepID=UPI001F193CE9|nr:hypothetical protein [Pseudomonas sp. KNUC1026]UFH48322.1 hypothetical protein LN139_14285 [Pseudomonas sp. KNUC1026]
MTTLTPTFPHSRIEDGLALLVGTLLVAFGLLLVREGAWPPAAPPVSRCSCTTPGAGASAWCSF